ncbi:MAG TPA: beta-propeller fold lactonase family protein, partial [Longimicrobiales bacterium]
VVDVGKHQVIGNIDLERGAGKPVGVAVSPDGRRVYVANGAAGTIAVVDAIALKQIASIKVGKRPWGIVLSPDGRFAFTANGLSNDVSVVDLKAGRTVASIKAGTRPWGLAILP